MFQPSLRLLVISGVSFSIASCGEFNDPIGNPPLFCEDLVENALLAEDAPTFETWRYQVSERLPDGTWLLEQDIILEREDQLRAIYIQRYGVDQTSSGSAFRSIVACSGGFDNVWSVANKLDITYCFGNFSDPNLRSNVEGILYRATMDWELAGDVNFIHVPLSPEECSCIFPDDMQDNEGCEDHTDRARLRIRQADLGSGHPARAGYPGNTTLELQVDTPVDDTNEKLYRLITHELGHVLGFMHEHLRFDNSNTLSDCSLAAFPWRTVTDPDSSSIMGYGHCGGIEGVTSPDVISPLDRQGAAYVYNLPRNEFPSFTQAAVDDLLWFIPEHHVYTLWRAAFNPQGVISFPAAGVSQTCGILNGPNTCFGDHQFNKPIPVELTATGLTDVISYGPGTKPDSLLRHTPNGPLLENEAAITRQNYDTPAVGRFRGPEAVEDIWWVRPGSSSDPMGFFSGNSYSVIPDTEFVEGGTADSYFRPLVGLWVAKGSMRPNSQVIWYREGSGQFISYQSADFQTVIEEQVSPSCLTSNLLHPVPLRGDFDGDDEMEIFFASLANGQHVLWRDTAAMWDPATNAPCSNPAIAQLIAPHGGSETLTKPFVGDFDGDDSDDIFWYGPDNVVASEIWLNVGAAGGPTIVSPTLGGLANPELGDWSPVVGDFNGDLCDDILWFAPDTNFTKSSNDPTDGDPTEGPEFTPGSSSLWRSLCSTCGIGGWSGFAEQTVTPPSGAYPVGYDPRSAGRRADLDPCPP